MGLDNASVKFCCLARSLGVDFSQTLTIGRQTLLADAESLRRVFTVHGILKDAECFRSNNKFGDEFFSLMGAQRVDSIDYSAYEGATFIHDMNSPIPQGLQDKFSVVYDGGAIEHVFNAPLAFKNCMEMVTPGGYFLQVSIANNYMGHGFWQFSPELLFRMLSPENGFETKLVLLHEAEPEGSWYLVADPNQVRQRVLLCNSTPTYILTVAKKLSSVAVFAKPPLQSDYQTLWESTARQESRPVVSSSSRSSSHKSNMIGSLKATLPESVRRILRAVRRELCGFNQSYYRMISEDRLLRGLVEEDV